MSLSRQHKEILHHFENAMKEYMAFTDTVAVYPGAGEGGPSEVSYLALGLAGETGKTVDVIKKAIRRGFMQEEEFEKLSGELGDLLFYWTRLCYACGLNPADVMQNNVEKLRGRKESGTLKDR